MWNQHGNIYKDYWCSTEPQIAKWLTEGITNKKDLIPCGNNILFVGQSTYEGRKEMFYLTTHSTHFIYGYMASDIW